MGGDKSTAAADSQIPKKKGFDFFGWFMLLVLVVVTVVTCPDSWILNKVTVQHVWYYGWITAISTGAGVIPFLFFSEEPNKFWMGISNAIAGGMMIAASYSLAYEGSTCSDSWEHPTDGMVKLMNIGHIHPMGRTALGFAIGILFILITKKVLDNFEDLKLGAIEGANAQKMVLIIFVMTLHSLTEGIGIGVSFGGKSGLQLGQFISLSLAVHNIPEGLAVALVLTSRKISNLRSGLWAVFTSLPQPFMAIPAFIFVEKFIPLLPAGLGFAAGAMAYVAVFELLQEAMEDTSVIVTASVGTVACIAMMMMQEAVKTAI